MIPPTDANLLAIAKDQFQELVRNFPPDFLERAQHEGPRMMVERLKTALLEHPHQELGKKVSEIIDRHRRELEQYCAGLLGNA